MNIFTNIINFFGTGSDAVNTIGNEWSQDDEGSGHLTASDGRREGGNTIQHNINSGSTTDSGGAVPDIDEGDIASSIIDILQSQKRKLTKRGEYLFPYYIQYSDYFILYTGVQPLSIRPLQYAGVSPSLCIPSDRTD